MIIDILMPQDYVVVRLHSIASQFPLSIMLLIKW